MFLSQRQQETNLLVIGQNANFLHLCCFVISQLYLYLHSPFTVTLKVIFYDWWRLLLMKIFFVYAILSFWMQRKISLSKLEEYVYIWNNLRTWKHNEIWKMYGKFSSRITRISYNCDKTDIMCIIIFVIGCHSAFICIIFLFI